MKKKTAKTEAKKAQREHRKKLVGIWNDAFYVQSYKLAKSGLKNEGIAKALGVPHHQFKTWLRRNLVLYKSVEDGRAQSKKPMIATYESFVYNTLSPKLKRVWDELAIYMEENATERIERMIRDKGDRERQSLFVHALVCYNFNPSKAMKATATPLRKLREWKSDPDFAELLQEIDYHKNNFLEGALMDAVERGETGAIMFAIKNNMRDKYGDKSEVHHTGTVEQKRTISLAELESLPLEDRIRMLETIKAHKDQKALPAVREPETVVVQTGGKK